MRFYGCLLVVSSVLLGDLAFSKPYVPTFQLNRFGDTDPSYGNLNGEERRTRSESTRSGLNEDKVRKGDVSAGDKVLSLTAVHSMANSKIDPVEPRGPKLMTVEENGRSLKDVELQATNVWGKNVEPKSTILTEDGHLVISFDTEDETHSKGKRIVVLKARKAPNKSKKKKKKRIFGLWGR